MKTSKTFPDGTNIRLLLESCECADPFLYDHESTRESIVSAIETVGFRPLSNTGYSFPEGGYTSAFILAESHVVIHTWPEHDRSVIVEISVCDFLRPNHDRTLELGNKIRQIFLPQKTIQEILPMVPSLANPVLPGQGYFVEVEQLVESRSSAFQEVVIAETKSYGRTLVLDGVFQSSEKESFFYHEPLVHVAMLSHEQPRHVLICGGGDGAAAHEALKHPSVESCTLIEIDPVVADLSHQELHAIHKGALDDPRVSVHIADACDYVRNPDRIFDVVLVDITDPGGISETLYTREFFERVYAILSEGGCLAMQLGAPLCASLLRDRAMSDLRTLFDAVHPYLSFVPCYGTLLVYYVCFKGKSDIATGEKAGRRLQERAISDLKIVSPETYSAFFAIPPFLRSSLGMELGKEKNLNGSV